MDIPTPPKDNGLRNIIDKLAEFVARYGPEFETITKSKQKGNPKFEFLHGGEFYNYYMFKVASEQALLNQPHNIGVVSQDTQNLTQTIPSLIPGFPPTQIWSNSLNVNNSSGLNSSNSQQLSQTTSQTTSTATAQIENLNLQQNALREQIRQSEQNLKGQHGVIMQQQQTQIDEGLVIAQNDLLLKIADENGINVAEFDGILQPIIDWCTKDSISAGKSWILQHSSDSAKCNVISKYLLKKALVIGATFPQKLHLIYLINDVLHHCVRKKADELKTALEDVVIPMFCSADLIATDEQRSKLHKLLTLWESKANFFDVCVMSKLRSPTSSLQEYKTTLLSIHSAIVNKIVDATKQTFENYQTQHQTFIQHATQQIAVLETQKQVIEQQTLKSIANATPAPLLSQSILPDASVQIANGNLLRSQTTTNYIPPLMGTSVALPQTFNNSRDTSFQQINNSLPFNELNTSGNGSGNASTDFSLPPPSFTIPDLSKPPPGFTPVVDAEDLTPYVPYFELPAGLMVPLIRLEDYNYKPLDPNLIKLPPPTPPNERLIAAVEAFYSMPNHDRPRDGEGWEKLGLYEYYKVKNAAKKQKEEEVEKGLRDKSRSPTPIMVETTRQACSKRRYSSKSRSRSRSKSRSKSPVPVVVTATRKNRGQVPQRKSKSPMVKRSPSPSQKEQRKNQNSPYRRDRGNNANNRNEKSNPPPERERSISPPSFFGGNYGKATNDQIEESNKGHQMLMKMGWAGTGTGLGIQGQGIDAPITGGDVRDRQDLYKGVGINLNDPYENFRKNKGAAFITRMKARAEERS